MFKYENLFSYKYFILYMFITWKLTNLEKEYINKKTCVWGCLVCLGKMMSRANKLNSSINLNPWPTMHFRY